MSGEDGTFPPSAEESGAESAPRGPTSSGAASGTDSAEAEGDGPMRQTATGGDGASAAETDGADDGEGADGEGGDAPAQPAEGSKDGEGAAGRGTAPGDARAEAGPTSGAGQVELTPGEAAGLDVVVTDEPFDGGMPAAIPVPSEQPPEEAVEAGLAASTPEGTVAPEIAAGSAAARLFAEGGEVPDTVTMALSPEADETMPAVADLTPPRQLLPAWINELVN